MGSPSTTLAGLHWQNFIAFWMCGSKWGIGFNVGHWAYWIYHKYPDTVCIHTPSKEEIPEITPCVRWKVQNKEKTSQITVNFPNIIPISCHKICHIGWMKSWSGIKRSLSWAINKITGINPWKSGEKSWVNVFCAS